MLAFTLGLTGCETLNNSMGSLLYSKSHGIHKAIKTNNVAEAESIARMTPADLERYKQRGLTDEAEIELGKLHRYLSGVYQKQYLANTERPTLGAFQAYCRRKMQGMTAFEEHKCIGNTTHEVSSRQYKWREADKQRKRAEAARQFVADVDAGRRRVQTVSQAATYYDPAPGYQLLFSPMVGGGHGDWYGLSAPITKKVGNTYYVFHSSYRGTWGLILPNPRHVADRLLYRRKVPIVGRYIRNGEIPLADGGSVTAAVLEDAYIGN